jgi:hypothetical protein
MKSKNRITIPVVTLLCLFALAATTAAWAAKGGTKGKPKEGGGSDSGDDIKLVCKFYEGDGRNILDDNRLPPEYIDGDRDVRCSTGGTSQPNLSGIALNNSAGGGGQERQIDLVLEVCNDDLECMTADELSSFVAGLPPSMQGLDSAGRGGLDDTASELNLDMENVFFNVRPYRDGDGGGHIQNLEAGTYLMAVRITPKQAERHAPRVAINLAAQDFPDDQFQGILCQAPDTANALKNDVPVTIHEPKDYPLLYTVDTGGYLYASICSNIKDGGCGKGARASDLCTFHGLVKVKFTLDAFALQ